MIRNLFLTALRSLKKNRFFSFLNIAGLAIGMSVFLMIALYVQFERSYEDFVPERENIYRLSLTTYVNNELVFSSAQEWYEDYEGVEPGHRHISHLYGLYPSNQISSATPELFEAAEKTIERRLNEGEGQTGWSRAWVINFFARLRKGDKCLAHLNK